MIRFAKAVVFFVICFIYGGVELDAASSDPFPLVENTKYTYKISYNGKQFLEELIVKKFDQDGIEGFYFEDVENADKSKIADTMFGLGGYTIEKGILKTFSLFRESDGSFKFLSQKKELFEFPLQKGMTVTIKAPYKKSEYTFTVEEIEPIHIAAGKFDSSAKIKKELKDADSTIVEYFWLVEGTGMVKWERNTGRIDELVLITPPGE